MSNEREKEGQAKGFTVSDRRKRYEEPAGGAPETPATPPPPQAEAPAKPAARPEAVQPAPAAADVDAGPAHGEVGPEHGLPGPADFVHLIAILSNQALAYMGAFDDPQTGQSMANFPVASWHIDLLAVLVEKTKGNLTEEEAKLLGDAVANLKLTFVRASGQIKQ